ncbi:hypothetical protein CERSUDRAFT_148183 [Gelatoporia subvermispora B]|uniref:Rho termination factor-like N-terminal domain-containing protein n=1 Tax=Ceriporiopsis subvermispora (strain B) TaxID=914234 RepID=M2R777_CERS8|nr:hypothetical protein CERSUDRAFT_148183 [Gelatoporia subvermispora B]
MASTQSSSPPADLSKLTVPQLKALCKERKITGYSKLGKNALLEKLVTKSSKNTCCASSEMMDKESGLRAPTGSDQVTTIPVSSTTAQTNASLKAHVLSTEHEEKSSIPRNMPPTSEAPGSTSNDSMDRIQPGLLGPSRGPMVISPLDIEDGTHTVTAGSKRYAKPSSAQPSKKLKTSKDTIPKLPNRALPDSTRHPPTGGLQPVVPIQAPSAVQMVTRTTTATSNPPSKKRFKPLVVRKPCADQAQPPTPSDKSKSINTQTHRRHENPRDKPVPSLLCLDFPAPAPVPDLVPITLPPSLAQRKRVHKWAVILSGLSDAERRQCVLVSRMFRYAVYLSATHILTRDYKGRRLDVVLSQYPQAMTNMWPYLRYRKAEAAARRAVYETSFLARFSCRTGFLCPLARPLWVSPDDERQITISLRQHDTYAFVTDMTRRFIVSRMWFALSLGSGKSSDDTEWLNATVISAQEVVKGEIWCITVVSPGRTGNHWESFYVLQATCEVVGHALPTQNSPAPHENAGFGSLKIPLRADWSAYISQRLSRISNGAQGTVLSHLKWANNEDYDHGISKLWLTRISREGELGRVKHVVAERYVLACVVGNSISGRWMTTTEMAQDFAGLPERIAPVNTRVREPALSLYLPEHHYIESIHFTSSGRPLHAALAVVQTPHRAYYILRDNGMQIGCEEDGVAEIWQEVLGCDASGRMLPG